MKNVLIVDDDILIVKLLSELLAAEDICITTASDGAEGWKKIQGERFDLLITDIWMPQVNGWGWRTCVPFLNNRTSLL